MSKILVACRRPWGRIRPKMGVSPPAAIRPGRRGFYHQSPKCQRKQGLLPRFPPSRRPIEVKGEFRPEPPVLSAPTLRNLLYRIINLAKPDLPSQQAAGDRTCPS